MRGTVAPASASRLRHSFYPPAVSAALQLAATLYVKRWERALGRVEVEQRRALSSHLRRSARTELGRRFGFDTIRSYEDFARRVPVGDYDSFSPYIDRMRKGEDNLLVPEHVTYFGNSSGSSDAGRQKFLPLAEQQISQTSRAGAEVLMRYLAWSGERDFLRGFTLGLNHPATMTPEGTTITTTNPVLMAARQPLVARAVTLPARALDLIPDYDAKLRERRSR
jgi:hypothetical protein